MSRCQMAGSLRRALTFFFKPPRYKIPAPVSVETGGIGAVAQLGERCVRNAEVEGSTPFRSTSRKPVDSHGRRAFLVGSRPP